MEINMFYFLVSIALLFVAFLTFPVVIYVFGACGFLKDKNPYEKKCNGFNCTSWVREYICDKCISFSSHEEQMTNICLSCGEGFDRSNGVVATRKIVFNGKWARQINWNNKTYIDRVLVESDS